MAFQPSGGFSGNLGWNFQPGILTGVVLAGRIQRTSVVKTLSCGRKGSLRKGGNLLQQARPPGLRAFPGLNGTLCACPRESNFRNTSSPRGSRTQELRPKTVHMHIYHTIGMITPVYIHCIIIIQWQDCMANWVTPADHASPVASFPIGLGRLAPCLGVIHPVTACAVSWCQYG